MERRQQAKALIEKSLRNVDRIGIGKRRNRKQFGERTKGNCGSLRFTSLSVRDDSSEGEVGCELLKAGAEVYEYQPSMIRAKIFIVDDVWAVVGSTNFDHRSFGINDEVNLAVRDCAVTQRLGADFTSDLRESERVTLEDWRRRPVTERVTELLGWAFERQQ